MYVLITITATLSIKTFNVSVQTSEDISIQRTLSLNYALPFYQIFSSFSSACALMK